MARLTITKCDRCGEQVRDETEVLRLTVHAHLRVDSSLLSGSMVEEKVMDLCEKCGNVLAQWLSRDNTVSAGYPPVGYREDCPHRIPCGEAWACPDARLVKIR